MTMPPLAPTPVFSYLVGMERFIALAFVLACGSHAAHDSTATVSTALAVGANAPDARLTSASGSPVALADSWRGHNQSVVVFYRGFY
jgi:hypothetical protein